MEHTYESADKTSVSKPNKITPSPNTNTNSNNDLDVTSSTLKSPPLSKRKPAGRPIGSTKEKKRKKMQRKEKPNMISSVTICGKSKTLNFKISTRKIYLP